MILAGDIGGTKSHFGLFDGDALVADARFENAAFTDFAAVIAALVASPLLAHLRIDRACLAVAGPVGDDGRSAHLTNLPWSIDGAAIGAALGGVEVRVANDFAAAALGAISSPADSLVSLQAGEPLADAPRLVVGAGTGLGMAIVLREGTRWRVVPGEGGHVAFAPTDDEQDALLHFLRRRGRRVTWERVVAGPGLAAMHTFFSGHHEDPEPEWVGTQGLADPTSVAGRALRLFVQLYGAYAGDMALTCLPRGGVFLAGGIAAKILPALTDGRFCAAFNHKPPHEALIVRMPVHVATDPVLALRGAALLAR